MKRLLIIFSFLLLTFAVEGQAIISARPFHRAVATAERTYTDVLTDGNTKGWYMSGDGSSTYMTDDGSVISNWKDQSGNSNDLVNASGTDLPTKDAANTEIDFNPDAGTDDNFYKDITDISQPFTVYMVIRQNTNNNGYYIWNLNSNQTLRQRTTATELIINGAFVEDENTQNTYELFVFICNGASSVFEISDHTPTTGNAGVEAASRIYLGYVSSSVGMSVKEFIIRSGADSDADKLLVKNYLNAKYTLY